MFMAVCTHCVNHQECKLKRDGDKFIKIKEQCAEGKSLGKLGRIKLFCNKFTIIR